MFFRPMEFRAMRTRVMRHRYSMRPQQNHIHSGLKLNRTLAAALLVYQSIAMVSSLTHNASAWWLSRDSLFVLETLLFIGLSEWLALKLHDDPAREGRRKPIVTLSSDDYCVLDAGQAAQKVKDGQQALEKWGLLIPCLSLGYVALAIVTTGQMAMVFCLIAPPLQAWLYGYSGLGWALFGLTLGFGFLATLIQGATRVTFSGLDVWLALLPVSLVMAHFGVIVSGWIKQSTSRVTKLHSMATTDALTRLINRRQFNHQLDLENARARRYHHPLSLALFDIDDFKKINDLYGHPTGDRILSELGRLIQRNIRESDVAARYGGEEFALILPETTLSQSYEILERLRCLVEGTVFCLPDNPMTVTLSMGVMQLNERYVHPYELIAQADLALYEAKRQGKNRVVTARDKSQPVRSQ